MLPAAQQRLRFPIDSGIQRDALKVHFRNDRDEVSLLLVRDGRQQRIDTALLLVVRRQVHAYLIMSGLANRMVRGNPVSCAGLFRRGSLGQSSCRASLCYGCCRWWWLWKIWLRSGFFEIQID